MPGSRNPLYHGCGKCRYRPSGCRGCIAADTAYWASLGGKAPTPDPIPNKVIVTPPTVVIGRLTGTKPDAEELHMWEEQKKSLLSAIEVVDDERQSHRGGSGAIAARDISEGETFVDPTSLLVFWPSDYAQAHLGEYDYIAFSSESYMQLRDDALPHSSIIYRFNEANHGGVDVGQEPNFKWYASSQARNPRSQLAIRAIRDIKAGEELLVSYNATDEDA